MTTSSPAGQLLPTATISDQPLDLASFEAAVDHPHAGARVVFCGAVRDRDHGREVTQLEYVGHPSAEMILQEIAATFAARPGVEGVALGHRVGLLAVGDIAFVAVVASAHRALAFEVCAQLVDEVKARLPVWKRQVFGDGTDEWVNYP